MSELKACPYCGKRPTEETFYSEDGFPMGCNCVWNTNTAEQAEKRWNARPIEDALQSRIDELEAKLGDRAMRLTEWAEKVEAFVTMVSKETLIHDGEYSYLNPYQAEAKHLKEINNDSK